MTFTKCNFCTMKDIKRKARQEGNLVFTHPSDYGLGGIDVYVCPPGTRVDFGAEEFHKKYFVLWAMEISERCAC